MKTLKLLEGWKKDLSKYKYLYIMAIPMVVYYILFNYMPMYGAVIAFKDFSAGLGTWGSRYAGLKYFSLFFNDVYFGRILRNTIEISLLDLAFGFPAPIILALLINEVRQNWFKKLVQTVSYVPHFISMMVIAGLIIDFTSRDGAINDLLALFGVERKTMLLVPGLFKPIYIISDIWQKIGWGSIVYLGALTGVDPELYEAASIDGTGRFGKIIHVTIPGILPTIIIMLILRLGSIMNVGYEKIILLYNPTIYETSDVISSYSYRMGLQNMNYSYSTAVGLFNSVINFLLVIGANTISRKVGETSLW
ncbi:MAG: sugar ABC transporter permease [Clostridia bacterium]|nr:sugar ABC transporter permease [Clostridia bacterium]